MKLRKTRKTTNCFSQGGRNSDWDSKPALPECKPALQFVPTWGQELIAELQGAAERTPWFGSGISSVGERVQWCGARLRTSVYVPFSVYTMAWSGEHRAFIVEEFIRNGGSPVATQRAFRGDIGWPPPPPDLTPCDFFLLGYTKQRFTNNIP